MMLEEVVSTFEEAKELPAVKRIYKSRFVQGKIEQLEKFLGKIVRKNVEKAVNPAIRKLKTLNIILINIVVLSYFAGRANAQDFFAWSDLFNNYQIIGIYTIIANITGALLFGFGEVLRNAARIALKVFGILLGGLIIYLIVYGIWEVLTKKENN